VILVAGLTPAWQQTLVFDAFRHGEVNRAAEVHWTASGKVLNAATAAGHLGADCLALAPLGGHAVGEIDRRFDQFGIARRWIETRSPTRVCTTIVERSTGTMTELVENGRPLTADELDRFLRAFAEEAARADVVVLIGSLPRETPPTYYRELLETTRGPAVLDFRGEGLLHCLDLKPLVVKPNREELAQTLDRKLDTDELLLGAMREVNARGAAWVAVTDGPRAAWLTSSDRAYRFQPPRIDNAVNPLGCGDSMAATIAWAVQQGNDVVESVRLGIAAAGDNLRHLLHGRLDPERVKQGAKQVCVEALESWNHEG